MNSIIRLDTRGRLVIPNEFRETLDLKEGDNVILSLDTKNNLISISPIYGEKDYLIKMEIKFGDKPGSLAKIADLLAKLKIDLLMTESKSFERGAKARWDIIADISKSNLSTQEIGNELLNSGFVGEVNIKQISNDCVRH